MDTKVPVRVPVEVRMANESPILAAVNAPW